jgi:signal transduction histidine kinase
VAAAHQAHHLLDKSTTRLYMLFMEMLDYSKQRQPNLQRVELRPLLDEVGDLLRLIDHKKTTIECVAQGATLMGLLDREWIFRCLVNLGSNALDALPFGGWIRLSAYMTEGDWRRRRESAELAAEEKDAPALFIEVEDNGCGVSDADLPHIFQPLFTTKESRGSGLGLACVRQFVEIMGGRVDVITALGEGTTFRLVFPVRSTTDE